MSQSKQLLIVSVLALVLVSCGDNNALPLASPTPVRPVAPGPSSFGVSGTISEVTLSGLTPLGGAEVAVSGQSATTNGNGFYSLSGLETGALTMTVSKVGYKSETRSFSFPSNALQGIVNIEIVRDSDIHILSGVVTELTIAGSLPVEGVMVTEMSCNAVSQGCAYNVTQQVATDRNGFYRFSGLYAGRNNVVWLHKDGYDDPTESPVGEGGHAVTLDGDTRFDIQIVRR